VKQSSRVQKGFAWAKHVAYLWLAFAAFKALFGLALDDPGRQIVEAGLLAVAGPLITAPFAFALGWLFGGEN
jgi:hypothetical protein